MRDPDAQRFLHTLSPGDRVDIEYTEALAVDGPANAALSTWASEPLLSFVHRITGVGL